MNRQALKTEYREVCSNFRLLTDIRFKLLAFLPIATAAAAALKDESFSAKSLVLSMFGLAVTIGLITYNARNDQLYNELVGRAAFLERSLGLPDGAFANRPQTWLRIKLPGITWKVSHGRGVGLIYEASVALWLFGVLSPVLEALRRVLVKQGFERFAVSDPAIWVHALALVLAVLLTRRVWNLVATQGEDTKEGLRARAASTHKMAAGRDLATLSKDEDFLRSCAILANEEREIVRRRAKFYAASSASAEGFYLPATLDDASTAQFIALLTDMPPGWILDCATNRPGKIDPRRIGGSSATM